MALKLALQRRPSPRSFKRGRKRRRRKHTPIHRQPVIDRINRPRLHEIQPLALDSVAVAAGAFRAERQVDF
ncbi:hypothetical protein CNMCM8980_007234 [Aspergillus fumigatiaffinis]|nr:hypothetical protein CNMCM8980_007234 [Aspergillus fumigatiaffinis]